MSVSGIVILIVLLLGLHIATSPGRKGDTALSKTFPDRSEQIAALRRKAAELQDQLPEPEPTDTAKPSPQSHKHLPNKYRDLLLRRNRLQKQTGQMQTIVQQEREQNAAKKQEVAKLTATVALIEKRVSEDSPALLLVPDRQTDATVLVVECSNRRIRCGALSDTERPASFRTDLNGKRKFVKHAIDHGRGRDVCFVFMIKPSSIDYALNLVASLREQNLPVGYDALEEDRSVFWR